MVPYRTALVPLARVATMPPIEASAPGSIGKNRPVSRRYSLSCLRRTPGCTTTSRSRSEEHTSELQSLMRISYAVFCLKKKTKQQTNHHSQNCIQIVNRIIQPHIHTI